MKKKIKCPECGDEDGITMWRSGECGYTVYLTDHGDIGYDHLEYDELSFETFSCHCGYENVDESKFIVEVDE